MVSFTLILYLTIFYLPCRLSSSVYRKEGTTTCKSQQKSGCSAQKADSRILGYIGTTSIWGHTKTSSLKIVDGRPISYLTFA